MSSAKHDLHLECNIATLKNPSTHNITKQFTDSKSYNGSDIQYHNHHQTPAATANKDLYKASFCSH